MTTTAKINAKGTKNTGITEDLAEKLYNRLGKTVVAVVELASETRLEKRNGDEHVTLSILHLEIAPNDDTEDHLRDLARTFHTERKRTETAGQEQLQIDDDLEPKVSDVLAAGQAHKHHDAVLDEDADPKTNPECERCGKAAGDPIHTTPTGVGSPFDVPTTDQEEDHDAEHEDLAHDVTADDDA